MQALQTIPAAELPMGAVVPAQPTVGMMLQAAVQQGLTAESVGVVERLGALYERTEAKRAEREFAVAFNALQAETPDIVATSVIPNRGKYARFEDVMHTVKPLLIKNGFSVSFSQEADDKRIKVTCKLMHIGGHSSETLFAVRLGGKADSDTQADCKASTTAKRNALLQALNIVIRQDCLMDEEDPRNEGGFITEAQSDELQRRVSETNSDKAKFLAVAGAQTFATIPAGKYATLDALLRTKERAGR
jgi:hypothetical protein